MREILFRGISKETDKWEWVFGAYSQYDVDDGTGKIIEQHTIIDYNDECLWREVDPETVGQYTGLTDKNGKKIFEGDIVKSCEYDNVYVVQYFAENDYPAFDVVPEINCDCNGLSHLHIVEGIEVIGNIHDNPELVKEGEQE